MQLPAFSGRKKAINLLPRDAFESSSAGVVLEWGLAFGKWAVIVTQLIVMAAFLWRFGQDRQLTNLRREIDQQKAIIASYAQLETQFTLAQKQVNFAKPVLANQDKFQDTLEVIQSITPTDVWYERLTISDKSMSLTAYSASLSGFSRLLVALQRDPRFNSVSVGSIEDGGVRGAQLRFDVTLGFQEAQ